MNTYLKALTIGTLCTGAGISAFGAGNTFNPTKPIENSVSIPLSRQGNLMMLEASVDGTNGYFLLDFGSQELVINREIYSGNVTGQAKATTINNAPNVQEGKVDQILMNGLEYRNQPAMVMEVYPAYSKGKPVLGLMGIALFKRYGLELDVRNGIMTLHPRETQFSEPSKYFVKMPFKVRNNILIMEGRAGGKRLSFGLDTGAEISVLDERSDRKYDGLMTVEGSVRTRGAGGQSRVLQAGKMNDILFGSVYVQELDAVKMDMFRIERSYGASLDGLLGFQFFDKGVFRFDFRDKEVTIIPHKIKYLCSPRNHPVPGPANKTISGLWSWNHEGRPGS